ncbi:MAG: asparagine--tRNA ligase [Candidatus Caldarchaeum sp.]
MDYQRTLIRQILSLTPPVTLSVYGWVRTRRDSKGVHFVQINDGSCLRDLQVVIEEGTLSTETLKKLSTGAAVRFDGELVPSPAAGQQVELKATRVEIYGECDPTEYPIQKKRTSLEFLRENAHLRVRTNTFGAVFRVRNKLSWAVHKFFQDRNFLYVHTPIITPSDCEGAGHLFQVTTLDLKNIPFQCGEVNYSEDFFGKPTYLTVSGQLEVEAFALGFTNCYTFGPTFRAENSNTPRHLAEFWMIEPEMAFCDIEGNMNLAEEFLKFLLQFALEECSEDLEFFQKWFEPNLIKSLESVAEAKFERMSYTEAIHLLKESGESFEFPVYWGADLQSEHERYLTEKKIQKPVILTDYPKEIKAFYMRLNDDERTVRAMDILIPRVGEIIGGSQREERHDVLLRRIREAGLKEENYYWYLQLRKFGSAPHAGFGLGLERMMMYVTGMKNIRDVIPFFRVPGSAEF